MITIRSRSHFRFTILAQLVHENVHVHFWFTINFQNNKFQIRNNFKFWNIIFTNSEIGSRYVHNVLVNASMVGEGWTVVILFSQIFPTSNSFFTHITKQTFLVNNTLSATGIRDKHINWILKCMLRDRREPRKRAESPGIRLVLYSKNTMQNNVKVRLAPQVLHRFFWVAPQALHRTG